MATRRKAKTAVPARTQKGVVKQAPRRAAAIVSTAPVRNAAKALPASDYEGARTLLSRYCALIDQGQLVELSELFHRNAKFSVSFDSVPSHTGRDAILAWYTRFFSSRPGKVRYPRHKIFEPFLVVSGNAASASTYFDSDFVEPNDDVTVLAGRYDDVLIKERGRWFFKERTITICYHFSPGKGAEGMKS